MSTLNLISEITYSSNLDVRSLSSAGKISKQAPIDKTCPSGDTSRTLPTIITFCQHFKTKEVDFIITLSPFQWPAKAITEQPLSLSIHYTLHTINKETLLKSLIHWEYFSLAIRSKALSLKSVFLNIRG